MIEDHHHGYTLLITMVTHFSSPWLHTSHHHGYTLLITMVTGIAIIRLTNITRTVLQRNNKTLSRHHMWSLIIDYHLDGNQFDVHKT